MLKFIHKCRTDSQPLTVFWKLFEVILKCLSAGEVEVNPCSAFKLFPVFSLAPLFIVIC